MYSGGCEDDIGGNDPGVVFPDRGWGAHVEGIGDPGIGEGIKGGDIEGLENP